MCIERIELDKPKTLNGSPAGVAANLAGQEAHPALMQVVVDHLDQPGQRGNHADNELHELPHAQLARTTRPGHRQVLLLACSPRLPGWEPERQSDPGPDRPVPAAGFDHLKARRRLRQ
jgi:hypothetical protein